MCAAAQARRAHVRVIPNHICPCVNLQDVVWLKQEDDSVTPLTVDVRGKLN